MKQLNLTFLLTVLMSMVGAKASAHDIEVKNADGVTIYYRWNSDKTELIVTRGSSYSYYSNEYSGNVVIPSSVTYNGKEYSVTSIGSSAFYGCPSLTSVTIPNSVTSIGNSAFSGCSGLKKVIVKDIAAWCNIEFGNYGNPLGYAHHLYSDENTEITDLVIPNSVTSIGNSAFSGCSGLTSVEIPNSVTTIGSSAFSGCSSLTVDINSNAILSKNYTSSSSLKDIFGNQVQKYIIGNEVTSIGEYAFCKCSGLTSVTIPNSVTSINFAAFMDCSNLTSVTIPNSVTSIGSWAFEYCSSLTSVTIGNSVTSIGGSAFSGCSGLKKVIVKDIAAWCNIKFGYDGNPLGYARHLYSDENTEITDLVIPNSVTSIGDDAFYYCSGLTSVTIPNSVTSIGNYAFSGCSGLTSVEINNNEILNSSTSLGNIFGFQVQKYIIGKDVTSIGSKAFSGCSGLTSVTIPDGVTSINSSAFSGCSGLTSVTIPNSVTTIGSYAFNNTNLKSVTIGSGVVSIGSDAFSYSVSNYNANGASPLKVIWLTNTPPSGYTYVGGTLNYVANDLYTKLSNKTVYPFLSSVFDVDGVKYVPVSPSERTCDAIDCVYDESASNVHIGNNVTYKGVTMTLNEVKPSVCVENQHIKTVLLDYNGDIPANAFYGCTGLQTVTISNQGNIGESAFNGCTGLQTATIGKNVTSIGNKAFYKCTQLQSIDIPDAVKSLGTESFSGCKTLISAKIGKGVSAIYSSAFSGCSALESVQIGSNVETIGSNAFASCTSLPTIKIPQSVSEISDNAFKGCSGLKEVIMEDGKDDSEVLTLGSNGSSPIFSGCPLDTVYIGRNISYSTASDKGYSPFYRNTTLRSVVITDKETEISPNEFYGCTNLKNVRIGDGVTTIGDWAFSGCSSLDNFSFGNSVETIGKEAFSDCTAMTKLYSSAPTPPVCGTQALDDINKWNCTLTVPAGHIADYQAADQWKDFFFIEEGTSGIRPQHISNAKDGKLYDLNGKHTASPRQGINIIKRNDGTAKKVVVK